jgi:hypothetical protein
VAKELTKKESTERTPGDSNHIPVSTHEGMLALANTGLECHVLDDGRRVFSTQDFISAFKIDVTNSQPAAALNKFLKEVKFKSIDNDNLRRQLASPVKFKREPDAGIILLNGYPVELLPEMCSMVIEMQNNYQLPLDYQKAAEQSRKLLEGFARVGIIALVDEATGYQDIRARDALQKILDAYLKKEHAAWAKRFPDTFYKEIFKLKKWNWKGTQMPSVVGKYTRDIVYARLAPGVLRELEQRNPTQESGYRKVKHHQFLTEDVGHPALSNHLSAVIALMKISSSWDAFYHRLQKVYPVFGAQYLFDFDDDGDDA